MYPNLWGHLPAHPSACRQSDGVCNDKENLKYMTRKLKEENKTWDLQMNLNKTQYLCIREVTRDLMIENNSRMGKCEDCKYLGKNFNKGRTDNGEIMSYAYKAKFNFKQN